MSRIPLVVGLPVHRREWVLDKWFDSLAAQDVPAGTKLLFCLSKPGDPSEKVILRRWRGIHNVVDCELLYAPGLPSFREDQKDDERRYAVLAHIRNRLLRIVAAEGPDLYLSWDSDIVLCGSCGTRPSAFSAMSRFLARARLAGTSGQRCGAVGALVDMGGEVYPGNWSWMSLSGQDAFRPPTDSTGCWIRRYPNGVERKPWPGRPFRVGVVMGVKLMTSRAYRNVRYADHPLGEDVGWAIQAEAMGVERWVCPAARGTHLYRIE